MSKKAHAHCWHADGCMTYGHGMSGGNYRRCCHCGEREYREWRMVGTEHGPHARDGSNTRMADVGKWTKAKMND